MRDDLPERQFLPVLRSYQLLLHRCKVKLVLDMSVSHLTSYELAGRRLPRTPRATHQEIFGPWGHLAVEGEVRIDLLSSVSLQEVNGRVEALAQLVMVRPHEICKEPETTRLRLKISEFLGREWEISQHNLTSGKIEENHLNQKQNFVGFGLRLIRLPSQNLLDLEHVQQQRSLFLRVFPDGLSLLSLMHIGIEHLGKQAPPDLFNDIIDIARDGVIVRPILQKRDKLCLFIEPRLPVRQLRPIVPEMDDLDVVVGIENGHLAGLGHEISHHVVVPLGKRQQLVGSVLPRDVEISDIVEIRPKQRFDQHLARTVHYHQLRIELLTERGVSALRHKLSTTDDLIVASDGSLGLGQLRPGHKHSRQLIFPCLHRPKKLS